MRIHSLLSPLTAATLLLASVPAAAQELAVASYYARPASATVTAPDASVRTVAIYRFARSREAGMPSEVTLADSAGTIVASYRLSGTGVVQPMTVEVFAADVLLEAQTPAGPLTIVIYQVGDPDWSSALLGRWMLGDKHGELLRRPWR